MSSYAGVPWTAIHDYLLDVESAENKNEFLSKVQCVTQGGGVCNFHLPEMCRFRPPLITAQHHFCFHREVKQRRIKDCGQVPFFPARAAG
jgi:hypothetical protein